MICKLDKIITHAVKYMPETYRYKSNKGQNCRMYICFSTTGFTFLTVHLVCANGVCSCRAAGLNEKPLAGDQCYWSTWAPALSRANWSITTCWFRLMEHDWHPVPLHPPHMKSITACVSRCEVKLFSMHMVICIPKHNKYDCFTEARKRR